MKHRIGRAFAAQGLFLCAVLFSLEVPAASAQSDAAEEMQTGTRVVLITGANRGIGLELARQFAAAGWNVLGTARRPDDAAELREIGARVLQLDVTDSASVEALSDTLSGQPIDLLINNAGILPMMWKLADVDFDAFERALAVNTTGPVRVTRALMPNLRRGRLKKIVNITTNLSSIAGNTDGGFYGYRESKAALNMFTRSLAAEFGPEGFICVVLHPGWVQTDMGGPQAPLDVEEAVEGMVGVIDRLGPSDNGSFWTYSGQQMRW